MGVWMGTLAAPLPSIKHAQRMPGDGQHILMNLMSSSSIHLSRLAPVLSILWSVNGPHLAHLQNEWIPGNDHYRTRFINFNLNLFHVHAHKNQF